MIRSWRILGLAALAIAVLATGVLKPQAAQAIESAWDSTPSAKGCSVIYQMKPEGALQWTQIYGFMWSASGRFGFLVIDRRVDGLTGFPVELVSSSGSRFTGDARLDAESKVFLIQISGRKDLESALVGDLTFNYRDRAGRKVSQTVPFGQAVPRTDYCMTTAAALATAALETEPAPPAAQEAPAPPEAQAPKDDEAGEFARILAKARPGEVVATGSGVSVDLRGHVITNAHVAELCGKVTSASLGEAQVIALDRASDLALLKFSRPAQAFASFRDTGLRLGEAVVVAGFPLGSVLQNGLNITTGNLSALSGIEGDRRYVQFTAPVTHGNSGGPVLDRAGRIIALTTLGLDADLGQNLNFGVAAPVIRAFLDENGVAYRLGAQASLTPEAIASQARGHTFQLECRK